MANLADIAARGTRVAARPIGGTYRGQVLPTNRKYTEPVVLSECSHQHRSKRGAITCAEERAEALKATAN